MAILKFKYRNAQGEVSFRSLNHWNENSLFIQGRSETDFLPKTYRKDRILEILEGKELLLGVAAPHAPEPKPKAQGFYPVSTDTFE